ncbi:MAG: hypothetical protein NC097_04780 [Clostridium sp.]|nr:hypothetical protein [Prevotella sp.]MCM1429092.1 hypothetical protein [Clostridium sp.]
MKETEGFGEHREDLLRLAQAHWNAMAGFRLDRERCKRYTYGRQWEDTIQVEGRTMREADYIRRQGNIPLKNNLIRRIVRNVLGVFRNQFVPPSVTDLDLPDTPETQRTLERLNVAARRNMLEELYARTMEEFLISGLAVHRKWVGERRGRYDVWTDYVQPDYFIIDTDMRDFRGWDATLAGEIHDVDFTELCTRIAQSPAQMKRLREIYLESEDNGLRELSESFGNPASALNFLQPTHPGRCRVIEIWRREPRGYYHCHDTRDGSLFRIRENEYTKCVEEENSRRLKRAVDEGRTEREARLIRYKWVMEECWRYYFLSPLGDVLCSGDSPFPDGSHPYVFKAYPFIDGEIHSFVSDLIDQQRYVNRLVTLYDWVMRASAKGVLLFPEGSLPDGVDIDDISSEWSRFNGVIMFRPKPGVPLPQQISGNAANIGITELLQVQLKMMEDVSGVNGALQGKLESGAVSGTLYNQQTRHALTGLLDILQSFGSFIREGVRKEINILQDEIL